MDTPLLALTRRRSAAAMDQPPRAGATENMRQLVQLRWLAVAGQLVTICAVHGYLGVALPLVPMLSVVAVLAGVNMASVPLLRRHHNSDAELLLALLFDVAALSVQLYLSGGATNPFVSLFLIQIVLGAILLGGWAMWIIVAIASICVAGLSIWNVPLSLPATLPISIDRLFNIGEWISFALVGTLLALFTGRIVRNLRARDVYVADMQRQSAEEDHIVRMGLFASGAAHELSTPLASLSVILSDWRRMPRLAADAELAGEIAEMQDEVQRCKTIVTDILHLAGQPRGEELTSMPAHDFLEYVIETWQESHRFTSLDADLAGATGANIVADPALRQAIWNLIDNAVEACPDGTVALSAAREDHTLVVTVRDQGGGFDPDVLGDIGRPAQSRKGPGHGVGLFLVSNVMRRLQGRLDASNHHEGGAEVRLSIPLVTSRTTA